MKILTDEEYETLVERLVIGYQSLKNIRDLMNSML